MVNRRTNTIDARRIGIWRQVCWAYAAVLLASPGAAAGANGVEVVASGLAGPSDVVLDAQYAYVTNREDGSLVRVDKNGGDATVLVAGALRIGRLVLDATHIYWTDDGDVLKMPKRGGDVTVLATGQTRGRRGPSGLAVDNTSADDGGRLYWANYFEDVGEVRSVAKRGGSAGTLAGGQDGAFYLSLDETHVYWTNHSGPGKRVMRIAVTGGDAEEIATGQHNPTFITGDAEAIYWTNLKVGDGTVMRCAKAGGAPDVLADGQPGPSAIAVDCNSVYWTSLEIGPDRWATRSFIMAIPKRGGTAETVAEAEGHFWGLAVDDGMGDKGFVYWTNYRDGTLCRAKKPRVPDR